MTKDIHAIQAHILKGLLLRESGRFSELKPVDVPSDQFTFHLKKLIEEEIIVKTSEGTYALTITGKEYANRFDIDSSVVKHEKQGKLGVLVIAVRTRGGIREYVMQERRKQPFFGFRGFITGKVKMGESVIETAARELEEEAGLRGTPELKSIYHERIYSTEGELLEDKYFFICAAEEPEGELLTEFDGGQNAWIPEGDVLTGKVFYDVAHLLALAKSDAPVFSEENYTVKEY